MPAKPREIAPPTDGARAPLLFLLMAVAMVTVGPLLQGLSRGFGSLASFALIFGALPVLVMGRGVMCSAPRRPRASLIALGALTGLANYGLALALQALPLAWLDLASPDPAALFSGEPLFERVALAIAICLAAPLFEEFAFRRALQPPLIARFSPRLGILLTALGYAAIHLDVAGFAARVEMGLAFGLLAYWSRSLWPAIAAHAVHNLTGLTCLFLAQPLSEGIQPQASRMSAGGWVAAWGLVSWAVTGLLLWVVRQRALTLGEVTSATGHACQREQGAEAARDPS